MSPNRVVALTTALLGLVAAIAVPLANMDWSSTAGVIVGIGTVALVAQKWLDGWQAHEARIETAEAVSVPRNEHVGLGDD